MKVDHNLESIIVDGMSERLKTRRERAEAVQTTPRLTGEEWLRGRLERGEHGICGEHNHAECETCGSVKCVGDGYQRFEEIRQVCDCNTEPTEHLIVPFDNFGQHVGFC